MRTRDMVVKEFLSSERRTLKMRGGVGSLKTSTGVRAAYEYAVSSGMNTLFVCANADQFMYVKRMFGALFGEQIDIRIPDNRYWRIDPDSQKSGLIYIIALDQLNRVMTDKWYGLKFGLVVFDEGFYHLDTASEADQKAFDCIVHQAPRRIFIYSLVEAAKHNRTQIGDVDLKEDADMVMCYDSVPEEYLGKEFFRCAEILKKLNRKEYERVYLDVA